MAHRLPGPADYALFAGLVPLGTVDAKRENRDVSGSLQQSKRYNRDCLLPEECESPGGPWDAYRLPFAFSANGRPYLRQLATRSGIWFCDLRRPENLGRALDGWYTPEGLVALLKRDDARAHADLKAQPFVYGFSIDPFQVAAIRAAEIAIAEGRREMLLAMATGTGKTKTAIALIYRRVLDYFDAVKIGLTATPALHTTEIFSPPIYTYSYREAVIDGYPIDHEPPIQIATELSTNGIRWKVGEEVAVYDTQRSRIDLFTTPDEIKIDVDGFNRKVSSSRTTRPTSPRPGARGPTRRLPPASSATSARSPSATRWCPTSSASIPPLAEGPCLARLVHASAPMAPATGCPDQGEPDRRSRRAR